jgi:hypothetical protein
MVSMMCDVSFHFSLVSSMADVERSFFWACAPMPQSFQPEPHGAAALTPPNRFLLMGVIEDFENAAKRYTDPQDAEKHPGTGRRCHREPDHRQQPSDNCQQNSKEFHVVFPFPVELYGFDLVKPGGREDQQSRPDDGDDCSQTPTCVQTR